MRGSNLKNMPNLEQIKKIREITGAGIVEVKKALEESEGDEKKAMEILKERGQQKAFKKSERTAGEGIVTSYVHSNGKIGVLVKLLCESDFVARNEEFISLSKDVAMHIAAMSPKYLKPEDVSFEEIEEEKKSWIKTLKDEGKPENLIGKIIEGKEKKYREEVALISQPFVKNPDITVGDLIIEKISKIGENIQISDFVKMEL